MCGRYYYGISENDILDVVDDADSLLMQTSAPRDIHPADRAPLIIRGNRGIMLTDQQWGYPGIDGKGTLINARAETAPDKRLFASGIRRHRAVIPASGFYEWNKNKEKSTFVRDNAEILFMAGFFDHFEDGDRFIILTTNANDSMRPVHDRMPLILEKDQIRTWITDDSAAGEILKQVPVQLHRSSEYEQLSLF